ncbi:MAG: hypothetical protein KC800_34340, partial [Candidatus Eremiobacteraeota bacterium]|nr:hypothetical protein [Candidatus Eremiobacteraeota bacterium]
MFTRSHRGMTIVEIVSATAILILILSISFAAIRSGQRTQAGVQSTISLTGDVLAGVRQLRKDLETTNLTSVSVFETPPSCSMATTSESQPISEFGTPAWNGHIYYTLEKSDKKVAKLIRWVLPESKPG